MFVLCSLRPEEGVRFPGTGVTDVYELLEYECWKLNVGPL